MKSVRSSPLLLRHLSRPSPARSRTMSTGASDVIRFHKWEIHESQIFFNSVHCYGLINLKPIVPGHVLLVSKRVVPRLADLTSEEITDLFGSVHKIAPLIEKQYGASALNIAVQDGASAGQSVPHVHVHLLPRKEHDFAHNDDVYDELERHNAEEAVLMTAPATTTATISQVGSTHGSTCDGDKKGTGTDIGSNSSSSSNKGPVDFKRVRQPRTAEDMAQESKVLRSLLAQL